MKIIFKTLSSFNNTEINHLSSCFNVTFEFRYEIPSDEEEENEMTGEAWDVALGSGNSSQSHIRLKDEENWSTSGGTPLSREFFNLDINILDDLLKNIPLHKQIDLDLVIQDEETFEMFDERAESHRQIVSQGVHDSTDITQKMMSLLTSSPPKQPMREKTPTRKIQTPDKNDPKESNTLKPEDVKIKEKPGEKLEEKVALPVISEPQEQRKRRNRNRKVESSIINQPEQNVLTTEKSSEPKTVIENVKIDTTEKVLNNTESEDLQFLESLENENNSNNSESLNTEETTESSSETVVPVSIIDDKEKKGLEDWLDDFLGD